MMLSQLFILAVAITRMLINRKKGLKHLEEHLIFYQTCVAFMVALPLFSASVMVYSMLQSAYTITPRTNMILIAWLIFFHGSFLGAKFVNNLLEGVAAIADGEEEN